MSTFAFPGQMSEKDLMAAAARQAAAMVAAEQAGTKTQIPLLRQEGAQQALQATNAASALSHALSAFPGLIQSIFQNAGQAQAGLAQGYTGPLREQVSADAAQENQLLSTLGLPQVVGDQSGNIANVLYGLGGSLPAANLFSQGAGYAAAANALPPAALLQGNLQAGQARAAAQEAIAKVRASMAEAAAKGPLYRQQALETLYGRQAQLAGQQNQFLDNKRQDENARFSQWLQTQQFNESVKQNALENIRQDQALKVTMEELGLKREATALDAQIAQKQLDLRIWEAQQPPTPKIQVRSLADGRQQTFVNGVPVGVPYGPKKASAASKNGQKPLTANQTASLAVKAATAVAEAFYGHRIDPATGKRVRADEASDWDPNDADKYGEDAVDYQKALKMLQSRYKALGLRAITQLLNEKFDTPGQDGRPWFDIFERQKLRRAGFTKQQIRKAMRFEYSHLPPGQRMLRILGRSPLTSPREG